MITGQQVEPKCCILMFLNHIHTYYLLPKGNTEREFLRNFESIVRNSLPHEKLKAFYHDPEVAKLALLNKVTFCSERIKVTVHVIQLTFLQLEFSSNEKVNNENCIFKYFIVFYLFSSILKISFQVISLQEILVRDRRKFV